MSAGGPDLFVVCKSCGAEVSSYITECPYCGNRLRKRAPKLDRDGRVAEKRERRTAPPLLTRLRRDEIPGIRPDTRPYATIALVLAGIAGTVLWRTGLGASNQLEILGKPGSHWWRLFTAVFTYNNTGYAFVTLVAIALFGWLLERRHGPVTVIGLFLVGGVGGMAATAAVFAIPVAMGGNGAALALLCAWLTSDLVAIRGGEDVDGDLIGAVAIGVAVALMPLAVAQASWIADGVGVVVGFAVGLPLARMTVR
ncbi:MAG TPA: rhomboid family intramembrane serine protease [Solirubrobacteraceae bacterium]|nr:rhomboid family intramembrane serine protease [Solirubrobacteraceae bacterium]